MVSLGGLIFITVDSPSTHRILHHLAVRLSVTISIALHIYVSALKHQNALKPVIRAGLSRNHDSLVRTDRYDDIVNCP